MKIESIWDEIPGISLTASRLMIAEWMARRVQEGQPIHNQMTMFVATDILDGVLLRRLGADTPVRRVTDGIVDHISVARVTYETAKLNKAARPYIGILATRGLVVGATNMLHLVMTGEVTRGHGHQKATNISTALFGIASASDNSLMTHLSGLTASAVAVMSAPAHFRNLGKVTGTDYRDL